jgi:hypothetical protein
MNRFNRVSILSLLVFALTSLVVEARIFDNITQQMRFIFFNLSGTQAFSVWLKFAFFVIIFAVLYNGGIKAMKAEKGPMKNAMAVIAFVVGLTSAIFVPSKLLMYIFRLYSAVLVVLFAMLPVGVGFAINQTLFKEDSRMNRILRAVVYFLITVFIFGVIGAVDTMAGPEKALYEQILEPLTYGAIIAFVVGIINLLMALGGDKVVDVVKEKITGKPAAPAAEGGGTPPVVPPTDLQELIREFQNRLQSYTNLVQEYKTMTDDLIEKINNLLSADTGYFEPAPISFDWPRYNTLITEINTIENQIITLIEKINSNPSWRGSPLEMIIRSLIERFEDLFAFRKRVKDNFYANIPRLLGGT